MLLYRAGISYWDFHVVTISRVIGDRGRLLSTPPLAEFGVRARSLADNTWGCRVRRAWCGRAAARGTVGARESRPKRNILWRSRTTSSLRRRRRRWRIMYRYNEDVGHSWWYAVGAPQPFLRRTLLSRFSQGKAVRCTSRSPSCSKVLADPYSAGGGLGRARAVSRRGLLFS